MCVYFWFQGYLCQWVGDYGWYVQLFFDYFWQVIEYGVVVGQYDVIDVVEFVVCIEELQQVVDLLDCGFFEWFQYFYFVVFWQVILVFGQFGFFVVQVIVVYDFVGQLFVIEYLFVVVKVMVVVQDIEGGYGGVDVDQCNYVVDGYWQFVGDQGVGVFDCKGFYVYYFGLQVIEFQCGLVQFDIF